ncbi:PAAR domain-containing protein [Photorhabdus noenieputensis]|uniref:PAAR domain-containing protein n=1 Tax=Photorhabdus noenieputensis TaxID=1208607 RepID=UPI001BD39793|nr:PAAR domain-containing protein [Photorhabdus noenieputensis]MBS9435997.1 PAAR domain-containing protein [Photorhabdus noenieputensis]MCK3667440.1 PAAR domain-containing protein [Photorhabdus noenieputensis]
MYLKNIESSLLVESAKSGYYLAINEFAHNGIPIAGKENLVECPQCEGIFPIIQGADSLKYKGKPIALEGMQTACEANLIASQSNGLSQ